MLKYVLKRVAIGVLTIFIIASITFFLCHAIPGGPFDRDKPLNETIIANLNEKYHLDDPMWKQYVRYMVDVAKFDFGPSYYYKNETVNDYIDRCFPVSAVLGFMAIVVALLLGVPLGVLSALRQNKLEDNVIKVITTLLVSLPNFVVASGLMYYLAYKLGLLPPALWGSPQQAVMPVLSLAAYPVSYFTKMMKSSMLEVMDSDYVRTAKAKGCGRFLMTFKHALKNALLPIVTSLGPMFAGTMTGSFVVEKIFTIPGLGEQFTKSIFNRDYPMIMGLTIFYSVLLIAFVLIADIANAIIDPRIKLEGENS